MCLTLVTCIPQRVRGRRPVTKSRNQIVIPPISCALLFENSTDLGDEAPLLRKTQHNNDCKKYFECVTNHWLIRDCPTGTTFNLDDKGCDLLKACEPSTVKELYDQGVDDLKWFLGLDEPTESWKVLNVFSIEFNSCLSS